MKRFFVSAVALAAAFGTLPSFSATVSTENYKKMADRANKTGSVPVDVVLTSMTPGQVFEDYQRFKNVSIDNAERLIAELGAEVKPGGLRMHMGAMNIWVSAAGLEIIAKSKNAVSMTPGSEWNQHTLIGNVDGSLAAVDTLLKKNGSVDVEVILSIDEANYDIDSKTGRADYIINTAELKRQASEEASILYKRLGLTGKNREANSAGTLSIVEQSALETNGKITLKANEIGLADLAKDESIRAIRPIGYSDTRPVSLDPDAFKFADKAGSVRLLVQMRSPFAGGKVTPESFAALASSNRKILTEIVSPFKAKVLKLMPISGAALVDIDKSQLDALSKTEDKRFWSFLADKPMYDLSLSTSVPSMNFPYHHGLGRTGAGQIVAVLDSGIRSSHLLLQNNGVSKVIYEGCYQTNSNIGGTWISQCLSPNSLGDSTFGTPGSGEPMSSTVCLSAPNDPSNPVDLLHSICNHGTHIAGIATGKPGWVNLTGVAPDASLASFNVLTIGHNNEGSPGGGKGGIKAHAGDVVVAMEDLANFASTQPGNVPITVNLSFGSSLHNQPAPYDSGFSTNSFATSVTTLRGRNVPVVAAMGNNGDLWRMNNPASVPGVIKVGSVRNNVQNLGNNNTNEVPGNTLGIVIVDGLNGSNRVIPDYWPGEFIFFAPGGQTFPTGIESAYAYGSSTATTTIAGTSMATPHVAGAYAVLKAFDPSANIDTISNFIKNTYSVDFDGEACNQFGPGAGNCASNIMFKFVFFKQ